MLAVKPTAVSDCWPDINDDSLYESKVPSEALFAPRGQSPNCRIDVVTVLKTVSKCATVCAAALELVSTGVDDGHVEIEWATAIVPTVVLVTIGIVRNWCSRIFMVFVES